MITRHLTRCLAVAGIAALSTACVVDAKSISATGSFDRTLTVAGPVDLDIQTGSGSIEIRPGASGQLRVVGHIRASGGFWNTSAADDRVRAIEANPPIVQHADAITVGEFPRSDLFQNINISYQVYIPDNTLVRSRAGSGAIDVLGASRGLTARAGSGSITARQIGGDVSAEAGSGRIDVEYGGAGSGSFATGSGAIRVEGARGALTAHAGSGSITVDGSPSRAWIVETGSGGITLRLPSAAAFDFDARTGSGSISVNHPLEVRGEVSKKHVQGQVRGGGPLLRLSAGSGSIRLD